MPSDSSPTPENSSLDSLIRLYSPNEEPTDAPQGLGKEQFIAQVEALFPDILHDLTVLPIKIETLPVDLALLVLKKMPTALLTEKLTEILSWPTFSKPENNHHRDDLLNHYFFERPREEACFKARCDLYFTLYFTFNRAERSDPLGDEEDKTDRDIRLKTILYFSWHKVQIESRLPFGEYSRFRAYFSVDDVEHLLKILPSGIPTIELTRLAEVFLKFPQIVNKVINSPYRLSKFVTDPVYKAIFTKIEAEIEAKIKTFIPDDFLKMLDERSTYYTQRETFLRTQQGVPPDASLAEKISWYSKINNIVQLHRYDYILTEPVEDKKSRCLLSISTQAGQILTTLKINEGRSIVAQFLRMLKSIAVALGLTTAEDTASASLKTVSQNRGLFFNNQNTKTVQDLLEVEDILTYPNNNYLRNVQY